MQNKYHGWIIVKREPGYADTFWVEYDQDATVDNVAHNITSTRQRRQVESAALAVEFFDKRAGEPVKLTETPLGAYRVYTEVPTDKVVISRTKSQDVRANALRMECQRLVATVRACLDVAWVDRPSHQIEMDQHVVKLCEVAEQLAEYSK